MKNLLPNAALALGLGGALWFNGAVSNKVTPLLADTTSGMSQAQQEKIEKIASASLFGQFRSSMSDFLWLKVDKYVHNGVDLRATTPEEKAAATADAVGAAHDDGNREHKAGEETTVVPSRASDWRGKFGDVERAIQPYQDMAHHEHHDPKEALPLFRLMTLSNPHFIPGYTVGAAMIARDKTKLNEAQAFLNEGLKNNPQSIEIEDALGSLLTQKRRDYAAAMPHLQHAITLGMARDFKTLTDDESEAFQNSFRWTVLNRREAGDQRTALKVAKAGLSYFPNDPVCRHYLEGKR